jgi:hypothetical protein
MTAARESSIISRLGLRSITLKNFNMNAKKEVPVLLLTGYLGSGAGGKEKVIVGKFPFAGDYTVSLTIYTADGSAVTKSQVIKIANNDYSLINTPAYVNLTGGALKVGKTKDFYGEQRKKDYYCRA